MDYPKTTLEQARALLNGPLMATGVDERVLTARIDEDKNEIIFEGGAWGPHFLRINVTPVEHIIGHWDGYVEMHLQFAERRDKLRLVPAGVRYKPKET